MKFLALAFLFTLVITSQSALAQQTQPPPIKPLDGNDIDGVYSGTIKLIGYPDVPIRMALQTLGRETTGDGDEFFSEKKILQGAFILDEESDPFTFNVADYQLDDGSFDLQYNRIGSLGTTSSVISLRFRGVLDANGHITGKVSSGIKGGDIGTFDVYRTTRDLSVLEPKPKYTGDYKGCITFVQKDVPPRNLVLTIANVGSAPATNPSNLELGTTPGRVGNFTFLKSKDYPNDTPPFGLSSITIDYLRHHIAVTFTVLNAASTIAGGFQTLDATLSADGKEMTGSDSSTGTGLIGSFKLSKEGNSQCGN